MSNSDSMSMGGAASAIGPLLMRKVAPLTVQMQDISAPEQEFYQDSIFASIAERLRNISFHVDSSARVPEESARIHTIASQLSRATIRNSDAIR